MIVLYKSKSDTIGMLASSLCLVHCLITPFLFIAQAQIACCETSTPFWWKILDYVFLVISFFAIYWSAKTTSKQWMKYALWSCWFFLSVIIINEKVNVLHIPEYAIYIPAISLVFLHLYNKKYCQCQEDKCCAIHQKSK
ncbi:MerC domain-containing protein [Kordia algicida OT-1]|nr:MerC domain-containing protein [Kordia algicida]